MDLNKYTCAESSVLIGILLTQHNYKKRREIVPDCIKLTPKNLKALDWMPNTCAYKLLNDVV